MLALCKKTQYDPEELQGALKIIKSLNPRPGDYLDMTQPDYIAPDVYVEKVSDRWEVRLNSNNAPKLKINEVYSNLIKRSDNSDQNQYLKDIQKLPEPLEHPLQMSDIGKKDLEWGKEINFT